MDLHTAGLVILPSLIGTLKSTRINTRFPSKDRSVIDNLLESDIVDCNPNLSDDPLSMVPDPNPDAHARPFAPFMTSTPENSLGLQLEQLQIADTESTQLESQVTEQPSDSKEKKKEKPYVNPERFKTGGSQRVWLSSRYDTEY